MPGAVDADPADTAQEAFIRRHLRVAPAPFSPSLLYYAAHSGSGLSRLPDLFADAGTAPYWAHLWPGGSVLAQHLLVNPGLVAGRRVLDLGCGAGLAGIVAAKSGAASVLCSDSDAMARIACRLNAGLNDEVVEVTGKLSPPDLPDADLVLAGDVFYDAKIAAAVEALLSAFRIRGADVLVGDIGRAWLPLGRLDAVGAYPVRDVGDSPATPDGSGGVFAFR